MQRWSDVARLLRKLIIVFWELALHNLQLLSLFIVIFLTDNLDFHFLVDHGSLCIGCHSLCFETSILYHNIRFIHLAMLCPNVLDRCVWWPFNLYHGLRSFPLVCWTLNLSLRHLSGCQTYCFFALDVRSIDSRENIDHIVYWLSTCLCLEIFHKVWGDALFLPLFAFVRLHFCFLPLVRWYLLRCAFLLLLNDLDRLEFLKLLQNLLSLLSIIGHVELLSLAYWLRVSIFLPMHCEWARL